MELLAISLGVERLHYRKFFEDGRSIMRCNYYPPCENAGLTLGTGPHCDPTSLTILHQDQVGGLEVFANNRWLSVKPRPDALVINIGDTFMVPFCFCFCSCLFYDTTTTFSFFYYVCLKTTWQRGDKAQFQLGSFAFKEELKHVQKGQKKDNGEREREGFEWFLESWKEMGNYEFWCGGEDLKF